VTRKVLVGDEQARRVEVVLQAVRVAHEVPAARSTGRRTDGPGAFMIDRDFRFTVPFWEG
jgi:hypothetical protein